MAAEYFGQHLKLNSTHCWELTKSVMMLWELVTTVHVAVKGLCMHTCAGAVEGLSTQMLLVLKVSCCYCSKHWKIMFRGFDFLARFLGFGFSLFSPH
jgi:hypothetical protein